MRDLTVAPKQIEPLIQIHPGETAYETAVTCRDCGPIPLYMEQPTITYAGLQANRHLAAHLEALAAEIKEAAR